MPFLEPFVFDWHLLWTIFLDSKWCLDPWCSRKFQKRGDDESLLVPMALRGMESQLSLFGLVTPNPLEMNIECTQTVNVCFKYLHFFYNKYQPTIPYIDCWGVWQSLVGGFKYFFFNLHPYLGKIPILTNISQTGWTHQLVNQIYHTSTVWMYATHMFIFKDGRLQPAVFVCE